MAEMIHKSKVSTFEWGIVIGLLIVTDIAQIILDFFAIGVVVNRIIDVIVALGLVFYLLIRGELSDPGTRTRTIAIIAASFAAEEVPVLDAAPFWSGDGIYLWNLSRKRNKAAEAQESVMAKLQKQKQLQSQQERISKLQEIRERQQMATEDLYEDAA